MIDFLTQQENIQAYIETNYPKVLEEIGLENVGAYINDFLDFDKYNKKTGIHSYPKEKDKRSVCESISK